MSKLEVRGVTKRFGDTTALDGVTITLEENRIYGLLGRNGAGKTTLLNVMTGRLFPDQGQVLLNGSSVIENDRQLSNLYLMTEQNYYPESFQVADVFRWTGQFYGGFDREYAHALCGQFGLKENKKLTSLSTGYASIAKIIAALSVDVPFVLLDEPVLGLDANHRELFYKLLLKSYSDRPRTFVLSTHLIEEISGLLEEIVIIKQGKVLRQEQCEDLLRSGYTASGAAAALDRFLTGKNVIGTDALGGLKTAYVLGAIDRSQVPAGIEITRLDLQKLFIELTRSEEEKRV